VSGEWLRAAGAEYFARPQRLLKRFWAAPQLTVRPAEILMTPATYLSPTSEQGRAFITRGISGSVMMLNLLRFRPTADYSATPALAPNSPISGEEAYRLYTEHTLPYLQASGGEVVFFGRGGNFLIGPTNERWDAALLVRQSSVAAFMAFATNQGYLSGIGHRTAALEDSRLLPLVNAQA